MFPDDEERDRKEIQDFCKRTKEITKELCKSKAFARKFLYKGGFITKKGKLRKCYRD